MIKLFSSIHFRFDYFTAINRLCSLTFLRLKLLFDENVSCRTTLQLALPPTPTLIASNKLLKNVFFIPALFKQGRVFYSFNLPCQSVFCPDQHSKSVEPASASHQHIAPFCVLLQPGCLISERLSRRSGAHYRQSSFPVNAFFHFSFKRLHGCQRRKNVYPYTREPPESQGPQP